MVTADHGPAVSGAHNTIVTARAGKDLVSSLTSGLLTIVSEALSTYGVEGLALFPDWVQAWERSYGMLDGVSHSPTELQVTIETC